MTAEAALIRHRTDIASGLSERGLLNKEPACAEGCVPCDFKCGIMTSCLQKIRSDLIAQGHATISAGTATVH